MAREIVVYPAGSGSSDPGLVLTNASAGYRVLKGVRGLGRPPIELAVEETPLLDGGVVTDAWAPPRLITLPMMILADTEAAFRARVRALLAALSFGQRIELEVGQPDGQRRRIGCHYAGGLEGDESPDTGDDRWHKAAVTLVAEDPFWYDPTPVTVSVEHGGASTFFPFFPLALSPATVLGTVTVDNPGDVLAWPSWTITAPATDVQLSHLDYGEELHLTGTLPSSEVLLIVTRPNETDIVLSDGTDWWDKLVGIPTLWPLRPGPNTVSLVLTGADTGSSITGSFVARYESAW